MDDEIKFFMELFPDLDEDDIEEMLEAVGMDIKSRHSTNYTDFKEETNPDTMTQIKKSVLSKLAESD